MFESVRICSSSG